MTAPRRTPCGPEVSLVLGERYGARGLGVAAVLLDYQGYLTPLGHEIAAQEIETALVTW